MNSVRYFVALFLVISLPPVFLYWLLVHPFVNFWRGQGIGVTYGCLLAVAVVLGGGRRRTGG